VLPLLVAAGIEAGRAEDRSGTKITLRKSPTDDATNATGGERGRIRRKPVATQTQMMPRLLPPGNPLIERRMATVATVLEPLGKVIRCATMGGRELRWT
jgi:hypothetical protein